MTNKTPLQLALAATPRLKKPKRKNEEFEIQKAYFHAILLHQKTIPEMKWVHASMNGRYSDPRTAAMSKAVGLKKGIWDVHIPFARCGHTCAWIEFKTEQGELTDEQIDFRSEVLSLHKNELLRAEPLFLVYRNWSDAFDFTKLYLKNVDVEGWPKHVFAAMTDD